MADEAMPLGLFQWIFGGVMAAGAAVVSWTIARLGGLDRRTTVLESRPYVDPIEHAKVITELTLAVASLTTKIAESNQLWAQQILRIEKHLERLEAQLETLTKELA